MIIPATKTGHKLTIFLVIMILSFNLGVLPAVAETGESKWALDRVKIGEGGENIVPAGDRFEGTFDKWAVSQSSINYHAREIDHYGADDYTNAVYQFTLPEFPDELISGQQVELTASGTAAGYMREEYYVVVLDFWGDRVVLSGENSAGDLMVSPHGPFLMLDIDYENWIGETWVTTVTDVPSSDSISVRFDVPRGEIGDEFSITANGKGGINAFVEWVYKCVDEGQEYGVIERDGALYLVSPPEGTLSISTADLPEWAQGQMVTAGSMAVCVGPPATVSSGDSSILLDGLPVARLGDTTTHGGVIVGGSDKIYVNGVPAAFHGGFQACPIQSVPDSPPHVGGPVVSSLATISSRIHLPQLQEDVTSGDTVLEVETEEIEVGDAVIIGSDGELSEMARVIDKGSLILDRPLENSYPAGTLITKVPDEYSDTVPTHISEYDPTESILSEDTGPIADFFVPGFPFYELLAGVLLVTYLFQKTPNNLER